MCAARSPGCYTNLPARYINNDAPFSINCNVYYNGSRWQRPRITCFNAVGSLDNSSISGYRDINVTTIVNLRAAPPVVSWTCKVHFATMCPSYDQPTNLAQNVPLLVLPWSTATIFVRCKNSSSLYLSSLCFMSHSTYQLWKNKRVKNTVSRLAMNIVEEEVISSFG